MPFYYTCINDKSSKVVLTNYTSQHSFLNPDQCSFVFILPLLICNWDKKLLFLSFSHPPPNTSSLLLTTTAWFYKDWAAIPRLVFRHNHRAWLCSRLFHTDKAPSCQLYARFVMVVSSITMRTWRCLLILLRLRVNCRSRRGLIVQLAGCGSVRKNDNDLGDEHTGWARFVFLLRRLCQWPRDYTEGLGSTGVTGKTWRKQLFRWSTRLDSIMIQSFGEGGNIEDVTFSMKK
jgi:hypothetical protein